MTPSGTPAFSPARTQRCSQAPKKPTLNSVPRAKEETGVERRKPQTSRLFVRKEGGEVRAPEYGYYEKGATSATPLRRVAVSLLLFLLFFCLALCLQQVATLGVLALTGARPTFHLGAGPLQSRFEVAEHPIFIHAHWWLGPHVVSASPVAGPAGAALNLSGLIVNLLFIMLVAANMKRGRNALHYLSIAANGAAMLTTLVVTALGS